MCHWHAPQGRLDIDGACRGFTDLAKLVTLALVDSMFALTDFAALFFKLYGSPEWSGGEVTASILATLGDYFEDYKQGLEPSWFRRCWLRIAQWLGHLV